MVFTAAEPSCYPQSHTLHWNLPCLCWCFCLYSVFVLLFGLLRMAPRAFCAKHVLSLSVATCFLTLHTWYPGVSMLSAYVFKCFHIFLVYIHFYVAVIKYHDQIHFWNKEFILVYSLEEQASIMAEGVTVSSRQSGRGRKLGDHIFKHTQGAERATWKLGQVMNSQSPILVIYFLQKGSTEPLSLWGTLSFKSPHLLADPFNTTECLSLSRLSCRP